MLTIERTDQVQQANRLGFWRQVVAKRFNAADCTIAASNSFCQRLALREAADFSAIEQEGSPFSFALRGSEDNCSLIVVMPGKGRGLLSLEGHQLTLNPGNLYAYHSCKATGLDWVTDCHNIILTFPISHLSDRLGGWPCDQPLAMRTSEGAGLLLAELVRAIAPQGAALSPACHAEALSLVVSLLASAAKEQQGTSKVQPPVQMRSYHKKRIRDFALCHLSDPDLDVQMIASAVGLSVAHAHRVFADEPLSLKNWIYEERLRRCHDDLTNPAMAQHSISDIAYAWGFNSHSHFCRAFQKRYLCSPGSLRSGARQAAAKSLATPG